MKYLSAILSVILLAVSGCEKLEMTGNLEGTWKVIGSSGGISGAGVTPNYTHIKFCYNNYSIIDVSQAPEEGSFRLSRINDNSYSPMVWQISFKPDVIASIPLTFDTSSEMGILFDGPDTLTFCQINLIDGYCYHFVREE